MYILPPDLSQLHCAWRDAWVPRRRVLSALVHRALSHATFHILQSNLNEPYTGYA
jgi:hypothetical protein